MSGNWDVMQCDGCKKYHFEMQGKCPHRGLGAYHQSGVHDRHYPEALRHEALRYRKMAEGFERNAARLEKEWRDLRAAGKPRFEKEG